MIRCKNGAEHTHDTVIESRFCWMGSPKQATQTLPVEPLATPRQVKYITDLGGTASPQLTIKEASVLIGELKSAIPAVRAVSSVDANQTRLRQLLGMIEMIPDGYYAVTPDDSVPLTFLRISHVKRADSPYRGCVKVQTIHGPNLDLAWMGWPDGRVKIYRTNVEDSILLMLADHHGAGLRYSREIGKCCRCNLRLTDERSRKYGVGPECEKHMPWMIEMVDAKEAGL